jgi:acyl transferase domain-containing protein
VPSALLGHSIGHHAALTCAGAFTVADGVRLLVRREQVVHACAPPDNGMTSLECGVDIAAALVTATADPLLAVACHNAPRRTVICGPWPSLCRVESLAALLEIDTLRLPVPHAFHGPAMAAAVGPLRATLAAVRQLPLQIPVFSPVTGRFCTDDDDLAAELADAVAKPVLFLEAVRELHAQGIDHYVEYAPKPMLVNLVRHIVPNVSIDHGLDPHQLAPTAAGNARNSTSHDPVPGQFKRL